MDYEKRVFEYIDRHDMIVKGDTVVVGLSGGADSVALFFVLQRYRDKVLPDFTLKALHVNHMLRGESADRDEAFCVRLCERVGIPLYVVRSDVRQEAALSKESEEEAGRRIRYEAFRKALSQEETPGRGFIAVAHHMSDQAETVLFNMTRGSGISGLRGMRPVSGDVIRPLLCVEREENEAYLRALHEEFVTDETNSEVCYSRNAIRHSVIPVLAGINSASVRHIGDAAMYLSEVEEYLGRMEEASLRRFAREEEGSFFLSERIMDEEAPLIRDQVIRRLITAACGREKDIGRAHVSAVAGLFSSATGHMLDLPYSLKVLRTASGIRLYTDFPESSSGLEQYFKCGIVGRETLFDTFPKKDYTKYFDYDKIENSLAFRYLREGDYIRIDAFGHKKSVKKYLSDEKCDRFMRKRVPLVCDADHVIWIVGYRISEYYRVTSDTTRVLVIDYTNGRECNE